MWRVQDRAYPEGRGGAAGNGIRPRTELNAQAFPGGCSCPGCPTSSENELPELRRRPLTSPTNQLASFMAQTAKIKVVDIFAGPGGIGDGFNRKSAVKGMRG